MKTGDSGRLESPVWGKKIQIVSENGTIRKTELLGTVNLTGSHLLQTLHPQQLWYYVRYY